MSTVRVRLDSSTFAREHLAGAGKTRGLAAKSRLLEAMTLIEGSAASGSLKPEMLMNPGDSEVIWLRPYDLETLTRFKVAHGLPSVHDAASQLLFAAARARHLAAAGVEQQQGVRSEDGSETPVVQLVTDGATSLQRINAHLGAPERAEQARFQKVLAEFMKEQKSSKVLFAEASTGVGKTRAYLSVALDWISNPSNPPAVVTLPTYMAVNQTAQAWRDEIQATFDDAPNALILLGQREFVSESALRDFVDPPDDEDTVRPDWLSDTLLESAAAWARAGAKPAPDSIYRANWTVDGLMAATGELWPALDDIRLTARSTEDPTEDRGLAAYQSQFVDSETARFIICTHAMLGTVVRTSFLRLLQSKEVRSLQQEHRKAYFANKEKHEILYAGEFGMLVGQLGEEFGDNDFRVPRGLLIVDEAHLLESAFASVMSQGYSLKSIGATAKRFGGMTGAQRSGMQHAFDCLRDLGLLCKNGAADIGGDWQAGVIEQHLTCILSSLTFITRASAKKKLTREFKTLSRIRELLRAALEVSNGDNRGRIARVEWSPTKSYPRIVVGRDSVEIELGVLWAARCERAILVSATLYDSRSTAWPGYMGRMLAVDATKLEIMEPVRPPWLYSPVTLHLPAKRAFLNGCCYLRKPTSKEKESMPVELYEACKKQWSQDVAAYVSQVYRSAEGGVLVLLRSYEDIELILSDLESLGTVPVDMMAVQTASVGVSAARATFMKLSHEGGRPIMFGTGGAWTGLDLSRSDIPAGEDNTLTDLVIPIIPNGANRSLTHQRRRRLNSTYYDSMDAMFTMLQGIGRLVRRVGLQRNRRLHILDARIHESKMQYLVSPVMDCLRSYVRRVSV